MRLRFPRRSGFPALARRAVACAAALTLLAALVPPARADIQNPGRSSFPGDRQMADRGEKPPNAVPQIVTVVEGGTVVIVLRARGHAGEMIDFLLRTPPASGTLDGEPHQLTLNSAAVTYTHRPGDNAAEDSFTYSVQTRDGPVSAEARVTIHIQEPPPVLAVSPPELDFGAVKAGESTRAEVTLTNQGGGEAVGRIDAPPPWVVDGPADYRLPRGASQTFALVFRPRGERAYTDAIHFRHETGGGVRLVGTGLAGPGGSTDPALAARPPLPRPDSLDGPAPTPPPLAGDPAAAAAATTSTTTNHPGAPVPSPVLATTGGVTRLEPDIQGGPPSLSPAASPDFLDTEEGSVTAVDVTGEGRSTLDLRWREPIPQPKSYRVELRYLSLDPDDRLIVDWRPYALTEFQSAHGFVTARLSGLDAETLQCVRVVSVAASGHLTTPAPLVIAYTLPAATWWRPTPLKVLFFLLILCGGMVVRHRWEDRQILREIDESRHRATDPANSWV